MDKKIIAIFKEAKICKKCYGSTPLRVPLPDEENGDIGASILFMNDRVERVLGNRDEYLLITRTQLLGSSKNYSRVLV